MTYEGTNTDQDRAIERLAERHADLMITPAVIVYSRDDVRATYVIDDDGAVFHAELDIVDSLKAVAA